MSSAGEMQTTAVVTAFLRHAGRILLVRRSDRVGSYRGCWSAISGYLENATPLQQARREIREETGLGLEQVHLVSSGTPLSIPAPELSRVWLVHPFLFDVDDPQQVRLDWENVECRWVEPRQVRNFETVPNLAEALDSCLSSE